MKDPWSRVFRAEPESNVVASKTSTDDVAPHWVHVVVAGITGASNDIKRLLSRDKKQKVNFKWDSLRADGKDAISRRSAR